MAVAHRSSEPRQRPPARLRWPWLSAAAILCALVLWGGYSHRWSWTGINGHTATLWDWLHLVLLPLAFAVLPLWVNHRSRVATSHKATAAALLVAWAILVVLGYVVPWAWTGFAGNTLWDWLKLVALPLAIALIPLYRDLRVGWQPRHTLIGAGALGLLLVAVLGGYLAGWAWTGFAGNTLWNWLQLLLLPLLLPAVIVPSLRPLLAAGVLLIEAEDAGGPGDGGPGSA